MSNYAQYCSVVKTGIGKTKMILGGEIDARKPSSLTCPAFFAPQNNNGQLVWDCRPEKKDDPINWVELKTSAVIENAKDALKYERKLMKFWIQSYLLGVPKIIVGFRNQHGILQRLDELETASIPGMVKKPRGRGTWDGNLCICIMGNFLECGF